MNDEIQPKDAVIAQERTALKISAAGTLTIALISFGFALWTRSEAILLDGIFFLIMFVMGLLTIAVSKLVHRPEDGMFHFGYAKLEPMVNLIKGLVIFIVCIFAAVSAVEAFLHGGNEMEPGPAILYITILTAACTGLAVFLSFNARKTGSGLLEVDAKNWLIDTFIGIGLLAAFILVFVLEGTAYAAYVPYADPAIVMVLILISLPIPVAILKSSFFDILDRAPDKALQHQIYESLSAVLVQWPVTDRHVRILKVGKNLYFLIHIRLDTRFPVGDISTLDNIRRIIIDTLQQTYPSASMDICFTANPV